MQRRVSRSGSLAIVAAAAAVTTVLAAPGGIPGPPGGGGEETATNNLSFPVIFPGAAAITIPSDVPQGSYDLDGEYFLWNGDPNTLPCDPDVVGCTGTYRVYVQKDPLNDWQAYWLAEQGLQTVSHIDVGDNLESVPWRTTSVVRVEFVPFTTSALQGFPMVFVSGQGIDEVWGVQATNPTTGDPTVTLETPGFGTIYDPCMELSLTKLAAGAGDPETAPEETTATYLWDDASNRWIGAAFDREVDFTGEINVKGRVIHGYNWMLKREATPTGVTKEGWWRLTFYNDCATATRLDFTATTEDFDPTAGEVPDEGDDGGSETLPSTYPRVPVIDAERDLVYIDVYIQARTSGGGGGGGGSGGGSGGGGPGGPGGG